MKEEEGEGGCEVTCRNTSPLPWLLHSDERNYIMRGQVRVRRLSRSGSCLFAGRNAANSIGARLSKSDALCAIIFVTTIVILMS